MLAFTIFDEKFRAIWWKSFGLSVLQADNNLPADAGSNVQGRESLRGGQRLYAELRGVFVYVLPVLFFLWVISVRRSPQMSSHRMEWPPISCLAPNEERVYFTM